MFLNTHHVQKGLYLFFAFQVIFLLATLRFWPIPWYDEAMFADLSLSFQENQRFVLTMAPYTDIEENLQYGPVYSILTSISTRLLGFDMVPFRVVNLLFSILTIIIFSALLKKHYRLGKTNALAFANLLLLTPLFQQNAQNGRMECVVLFFTLLSLYLVLEMNLRKNALWLAALGGLCAGLSLLTTPRGGVLILPLCCILLFRFLKTRSLSAFLEGALYASGILAVVLPWIFYAFGSVANMIEYYTLFGKYLGGKQYLNIPFYIYPLIVLAICGAVYSQIISRDRSLRNEINAIAILSLCLFHYFVFLRANTYLTIAIPYYFFLSANLFAGLRPGRLKFLPHIAFAGIALAYLGILSLKTLIIIGCREQWDPKGIYTFVGENIPAGSKVVGDYEFFYAVRKNGSEFASHRYKETHHLNDRGIEHYLRNVYQYDYLLLRKDSEDPENLGKFQNYIQQGNCVEIARYHTEASRLAKILQRYLPRHLFENYDCILYHRPQVM